MGTIGDTFPNRAIMLNAIPVRATATAAILSDLLLIAASTQPLEENTSRENSHHSLANHTDV
jgi:hypothetical protein